MLSYLFCKYSACKREASINEKPLSIENATMKSRHCRHCGDTRDKIRPSLRRWRLGALLIKVRDHIASLPDDTRITAERVSTVFRARKGMVEQCFARLNLEGILSQGVNLPPHDSTRDRWGGGCDSAWGATTYAKRV